MNDHEGKQPDDAQGQELLAGLALENNQMRPVYALTESGFTLSITHAASDLADELTHANLYYALDGSQTDMAWPAMADLNVGADRIDEYWKENDGTLPTNEKGTELVKDVKDPWGQALVYRLINRNNFSVGSLGPAGDLLSASSISLNGSVIHPDALEEADTWLSRRRAELGIENAATASGEIMLSRDHQIGGQNRFQGAAFFWFFTWLMLGTSVVFVPVAMLYRPQTYLMEEDGESTGQQPKSDVMDA
jgi:hypothetical protein